MAGRRSGAGCPTPLRVMGHMGWSRDPQVGVPGSQCPLTRGARLSSVSGGSVEAEKGLQARFRAVLLQPPGTTAPHSTVSLGLGLALGVVVLMLLLV